MKKKLLVLSCLLTAITSFAQFTTGTVALTGSTMTIKIDTDPTTVTMTLTGNSSRWLGIGFNGLTMAAATDMFIWNSTANRDYVAPGGYAVPSPDATQSWTIVSDNVVSGVRAIVATRALVSAGDYTFLNDNSNINIIFAQGAATNLAYHGNNPHAGQVLTRTALGVEDFSLASSQIYPNPSTGIFTIDSKSVLSSIDVYSQTGAFIKTIKGNESMTNQIDLSELAKGIYFLELKNQSDKSWKKIIVE